MNSLQKGKRQVCISVFHIFGASLGVEGSGVGGGGGGGASTPASGVRTCDSHP